MIKGIEIDLGSMKTMDEVAEALETIAKDIRYKDACSGIVGWSDVSWSLEKGELE